jgi:hypothetical protein
MVKNPKTGESYGVSLMRWLGGKWTDFWKNSKSTAMKNIFLSLTKSPSGIYENGTPAIFKPGLRSISPSLTADFNDIKALKDSLLEVSHTSGNFTIAAVNTMRIEELLDLGSDVSGKSTDQYSIPDFRKYVVQMSFESALNFAVIPFVVLMENGETITSTNYNGVAVSTAIGNAIGNQAVNLVYGETAFSRFNTVQATESAKHTCTLGIDVTPFVNAYALHYRNRLLTEQQAQVLKIGVVVVGIAAQVVYYFKTIAEAWHQQDAGGLPVELIGL